MRWGKRPGLFVNNSRFYVLSFSVVLSLLVISYMRTHIIADTLYLIRVQQIFGFIALGYWYLALLATPLSTIFGKQGFMQQYLYIRRSFGVSAAYFAVLHMLFGVFGQLGGLSGLLLLPGRFQLAVLFGGIGLLTLLAMALTSFDSVIRWMTFPRWKWLHRFGYVAACFVLLHIWIIGTHMSSDVLPIVMFGLLSVLAVLESWRMGFVIEKVSGEQDTRMRYFIFVSLAVVLVGLIAYVPAAVDRFHARHDGGQH